jgi:phosphoserine phosphatase RsbU/P
MLPRGLASPPKTRSCMRRATRHSAWNILVTCLLLAFSSCLALPAQTFSLITDREPVVSLNGLWRFHTGDNPAWADPGFDDSNWPLIRSGESWAAQGYPNKTGYAWYRFAIQVPDGSRSWALLLPAIYTGYQVFADGKLIGGEGSIVPNHNETVSYIPAVYQLPRGSTGPRSVQIAIRVWTDAAFGVPGGIQRPGSAAGASVLLARELAHLRDEVTTYEVSHYGYCLVALLVGLTTLVLFLLRPEDREYLWFSILLLASGASLAASIASAYISFPVTLWNVVADGMEAISIVAALLFFSTVLPAPRSFFWWLACVARVAAPTALLFYSLGWLNWGECHAFGISLMLPADIWFVTALVLPVLRKGIPVRWLLAPAALYYGFNLLDHLSTVSIQLRWRKTWTPFDFALISRPFPLSLSDIVSFAFVLSLLIFLVRRFSAARQEEARLSQEMEAARSVQSLLIPAVPPATPGFAVEHVYLPASEVGGDFFQVLPGGDGSLLIVVGDVSGKGLKAAMTVSVIVGALRGCTVRCPAQVLAHLNRALHGQMAGFFTCCAALIEADGRLTIANAGHLPPYLNGEELSVDPGLPLGIDSGHAYSETTHDLGPKDRLTFVSDGVVEARDASGELYGFARTKNISAQAAETIARTAQSFGQEDDITVLAVTWVDARQAVTA